MEVAVSDPYNLVSRVQVTCMVPTSDGRREVVYTLEDDMPMASRR